MLRHDPLNEDREDEPFLDANDPGPAHRHVPSKPSIGSHKVEDTPASSISFRFKVILFSMILAVEVGFAFLEGPMVRIMEAIACRQHYLDADPTKIGVDGQVPESLCKIAEVQAELAAVKGYHMFFDGTICALLAIPYGLLADRRGRKSTLALSLPGFGLNTILTLVILWFSDVFPLRTLWLTALTWLLGGGPVVAFAIIWTMMADVTTESERADIFFQFAIVSMGAELVSTAVSSYLMSLNPWIPLVIGFGIVMSGMMLILVLPETKHALPPREPEQPHVEMSELRGENEPKLDLNESSAGDRYHDEPDINGDRANEAPSWSIPSYTHQSFLTKIRANYRFYLKPYLFILGRKQVLLLLTAFLVYRLSRGSSWFLAQYISIRYLWTLAESNFLVACRPIVSIPLFLFGLPYLKNRVLSPRRSATERDLWLARGSIVCLTIGTLGIGLSPSLAAVIPSMIVQTSGSGFLFLVRSIITTLVERDETARLFTAIEIIQLGNVIASLTITTVFQLGLRLGGFWIGLAWMMTSSLFCLVGVAIWFFRLPPNPTPEFVVEDYDEDDRA